MNKLKQFILVFILFTTPSLADGLQTAPPTILLNQSNTWNSLQSMSTLSVGGCGIASDILCVGGISSFSGDLTLLSGHSLTLTDAGAQIYSGGTNKINFFTAGADHLIVNNTAIEMPGLASSSAAQTGTVCWTTGTGNLTVDTTTTCLASLEELKDIKGVLNPFSSLIEDLQLKPIWFSYKKNTNETDHLVHAGLGAHQVESVDNRLVGYNEKNKLTGVRYSDSISALNVASIKALQIEILVLFVGFIYLLFKRKK